jgi:hypothetical protein
MRSLFILVLLGSLLSGTATAEVSDAEIRQLLIARSLANYSGNCPCPDFVDRAGRRCGARSAYIKQGGQSPLCYPRDITEEMIQKYRREQT